ALVAARDERQRAEALQSAAASADARSISGLTTAASIRAAAAIGVLLGVGLYASALLLAGLCMLSMTLVHHVERTLPGRASFDVTLTFRRNTDLPTTIRSGASAWWRLDRSRSTAPAQLAHDLVSSEDITRFSIVPMRN
ncbi:MAG: MgtC/SapB family protein, partial [Steroidobacteraceae bacterium]